MADFLQIQPSEGKWYVGKDDTNDQTKEFTTHFAKRILGGPFNTEYEANEWVNRQPENPSYYHARHFNGKFSTSA